MSGGMLFGVTSLLLLLLCISAVASHVLPCPPPAVPSHPLRAVPWPCMRSPPAVPSHPLPPTCCAVALHVLPCPPHVVPSHPLPPTCSAVASHACATLPPTCCAIAPPVLFAGRHGNERGRADQVLRMLTPDLPKSSATGPRANLFGMCDCGYLFPPMLLPYAGGCECGRRWPPGGMGGPRLDRVPLLLCPASGVGCPQAGACRPRPPSPLPFPGGVGIDRAPACTSALPRAGSPAGAGGWGPE